MFVSCDRPGESIVLRTSAVFHLHNVRRIRKYLSTESAKLLVHAFVISRIDYCNSLLYGLPQTRLIKLQRVQHAAFVLFLMYQDLTT